MVRSVLRLRRRVVSSGQEHVPPLVSPKPDFALCARERIHVPGAIQPHGALLAMTSDANLVSHVSANLATFLGRSPKAVLGQPLEEILGEATFRTLMGTASLGTNTFGQSQSLPAAKGGFLHCHAHRSGRYIIVDLEPMIPALRGKSPITLAQSVLETFKNAADRAELCELAVQGLKAITGYDRVLAYRFATDGHGEVIAEDCAVHLEPYLGLRYPAGDIPSQARAIYLRQRVGAIADSSYRPVPLLTDPALDGGAPLDLTHSTLRSVSPIHCEYMRNMNTAASMTIGLAHRQDLWGMLVCHHATPRVAGPELRAVAEMIGQVVSLLLDSLGNGETYARRLDRNDTLRALTDRLSGQAPLSEALVAAEPELLKLVDAAGAAVRLDGTISLLGRTPPRLSVERALAVLNAAVEGEVLAVDDLGLRHPELACCTTAGSGALLLSLAPNSDDAILWFRPELSQTIAWGGNPAERASSDPVTGRLSARTSFAAWQETVRGHSVPWTEADLALAGELQTAVAAAAAQRTSAALARLRHYDSLTGLPNRSLLENSMQDARPHTGAVAAVLFLDLDRFKAVNDTMGHAAGDALLVEVAKRLLAAAGAENMAARLGGDEFVVLCRGQRPEEVAELGERIRRSIEAPFSINGRECHISASIGIAVADQSGGLDLVQAADMAMYAAKQHGGNRRMMFKSSLYDEAARKFEIDHDLREALSSGDQFSLLYQPLFKIASGARTLVGFEALLRWRHPRLGWIGPDLFIPQAEKSGLIVALGDWVLANALRQGRVFQQVNPRSELELTVNVSVLQLSEPGFRSRLAELLKAEGMPPAGLCLEVTESMMSDVAIASVLAETRKLGVQVAIDDFGTGYSSLSCLRRLPADMIKLDRSFLEDLDRDADGAGFVCAVITLAHAAGMSVVMEGIETQAQLDIAAAAGADIVQGFLLARPLTAEAAAELVANPEYRSEEVRSRQIRAAG